MNAHLRVARPTDQMTEIIRFYRDGLGLEVLGSFEGHDGFDGVMLGPTGRDVSSGVHTQKRALSRPRADRGQSPGVLPARCRRMAAGR